MLSQGKFLLRRTAENAGRPPLAVGASVSVPLKSQEPEEKSKPPKPWTPAQKFLGAVALCSLLFFGMLVGGIFIAKSAWPKTQYLRGINENGQDVYLRANNEGELFVIMDNSAETEQSALFVTMLDPRLQELKQTATLSTRSLLVYGICDSMPADEEGGLESRIVSPLATETASDLTNNLFLETASILSVETESSDDDQNGNGAQQITIVGLDASYNQINESVTLNHRIEQLTKSRFLRINEAYVSKMGSSDIHTRASNVGNINIYSYTTDKLISTISAQRGRASNAFYTVPKGMMAGVRQVKVSAFQNDISGNYVSYVRLMSRRKGQGTITHTEDLIVNQEFDNKYDSYIGPFTEGTDIFIVFDNGNIPGEGQVGDMTVSACFSLVITSA